MLDNLEDNEGIQYICKLMYEAFRIPVFYLDSNRTLELGLPTTFECSPLFQNIQAMLIKMIVEPDHIENTTVPIIRTTNFMENFIIFHLPIERNQAGTIVVGPSINNPLTEENVAGLMHDNNISLKHQEQRYDFYQDLTVVNRLRLYHAAMMLYSLITGKVLSITELLLDNRTMEFKQDKDRGLDLNVSYRRENTWLHHEPMLEREFFRHIKNGNRTELMRTLASFSEERYGLLSKKSHLRSKKNLAISSITLATRTAIDGGLFWEIAYTLSDFHIQHIEELKDIHAVDAAVIAALCDFADQVRNHRRANLSRTIALCQNYIFNHLYEELSLNMLAEIAGLNSSYLSQLFKRETGIAISDYIQRERIEEAKQLMELSIMSLSDIATRLHFSDQSYFTKVFKKYAGTTPKQYRRNRGITL